MTFKEGDIVKTLKLVKQVTPKKFACSCEKCKTQFDNKIVSMNYTTNYLESQQEPLCRFCQLLESCDIPENILNFYSECMKTTKDIEMWYVASKRLGSGSKCIVLDNSYGLVLPMPINTVINKGTDDEFIFKGLVGTIKGKSAETFVKLYKKIDGYFYECKSCGVVLPCEKVKGFEHCPLCYKMRQHNKRVKAQNKEESVKKLQSKNKARNLNFIQSKLDSIKEGTDKYNRIEKLKASNPSYTLLDFDDRHSTEYTLACNSCGSICKVNRANKTIGTCFFCQNNPSHMLGLLKQDHLHEVNNYIKLIEQNGLNCTIKCLGCGRETKDASLYRFLKGSYFCDCSYTSSIGNEVLPYCENCNSPLQSGYSMKDYIKKKPFICSSCGVDQYDNLATELITMDYSASLRLKLKHAGEVIKPDFSKRGVSDLLIESEPLYVGVDNLQYNRCFCVRHNKVLLLSSEEIENYNHDNCNDTRQDLFSGMKDDIEI